MSNQFSSHRKQRLWIGLAAGQYYPYEVHKRRAEIFDLTGQWDAVEAMARQFLSIAGEHGLGRMTAEANLLMCGILAKKGMLDQALTNAAIAQAQYSELRDPAGLNKVEAQLGNIYTDLGQFDTAMEHFEKRLELSRRLGDKPGIMHAVGSMGTIFHNRGDLNKAEELYNQWLEIAAGLSHQQAISYALNNLGLVRQQRGDQAAAMDLFRRKLAIDRRLGDKLGQSYALSNMGNLHRERGEFGRALELYNVRIALSKELGDSLGLSTAWANLGELCVATGDRTGAAEHFDRAIETQRNRRFIYQLCNALLARAELSFSCGHTDEAAAFCRESLAVAGEAGRGPVALRCRILQARIAAQDDPVKATRILEELLALDLPDEDRAEVHYHLYLVTNEEAQRAKALLLFRELREKAANAEFDCRIAALEKDAPLMRYH
ncbi:MAG: tetratricopeptide repeat protein [Candidatus Edwardsbacteria bacterium]|nr:tetratricopeptide repeat protein [Candidatus Edwardsbacteria bacterium]